MTTKEKRKEYNLIQAMAKEECGVYCVNCGSRENIEYHHIVPLACGGNNVFTNIVPLCVECHDKAHGLRRIRKKNAVHTGRPRDNAPVGYREAFTRYITGKWTGDKVKRELGLDKGARISEKWYYKEFLDGCGIDRIEKRNRPNKVVMSTVYYKDGHFEEYRNGKNTRKGAYRKSPTQGKMIWWDSKWFQEEYKLRNAN